MDPLMSLLDFLSNLDGDKAVVTALAGSLVAAVVWLVFQFCKLTGKGVYTIFAGMARRRARLAAEKTASELERLRPTELGGEILGELHKSSARPDITRVSFTVPNKLHVRIPGAVISEEGHLSRGTISIWLEDRWGECQGRLKQHERERIYALVGNLIDRHQQAEERAETALMIEALKQDRGRSTRSITRA